MSFYINFTFSMITDTNKAILWYLTWCFVYTLNMAIAKLLNDNLSLVTILFMRSIFGFIWFLPFIVNKNIKNNLVTNRLYLHILRILLSCTAIFFTYYAYTHLPIANATTIGYTSPFFIAILSMLILKEKVTAKQWSAIIIGYLGVLLLTQPFTGDQFHFGYASALLANLFAGLAIITVKIMTKTESEKTILLYFNMGIVIIMGILATSNWTTPEHADLKLLLLLGATALFSQYCTVKALQYSTPAFLAPFEYSRLLFAVPIGLILFHESIDITLIFGALVIISANFYLNISSRKKALS